VAADEGRPATEDRQSSHTAAKVEIGDRVGSGREMDFRGHEWWPLGSPGGDFSPVREV